MTKKLGIILVAFAMVLGLSMQIGAADVKAKPEVDRGKSAPYVTGGGVESPSRTVCDISEGFEAGIMPPGGWELISTHTGDETWHINDLNQHSGTYGGECLYDPDLIPQDEVLISPEFNSPQSLTFWSLGSLYWGGGEPYDNYDVEIWLVKGEWDAGAGDDIYLGKADDDWVETWEWSESTFDLSSYTGTYRIAFRYVGVDGAQASLDDICIVCSDDGNCIVSCDEDESGALNIVETSGTSGSDVTVTVEINSAPNNVEALGFDVVFNPDPDNCLAYIDTDDQSCALTADFDFFDCNLSAPGVVTCGGFDTGGGIPIGASGCVAELTFHITTPDLDQPDEAVRLDLQNLVDGFAGWIASPGYICGGCDCDVNDDGDVTPQDALCAFQKYLGICPTSCGLCEDICCDVNGDDQCTPADALEIFKEYLGMESVCSPLTLKVDQVNDVDTGTSSGCGAPPMGLGSLFQSFTPSASPLAAVDLRLRVGGDFPDTGYQTTIRVRSGTPEADVLGTATVFVPGPQATGAELEVHFEFSPSVSLSPGQTYVIEWVSPLEGGVVFTWMVADYDSYPGGTAYGCTGSIIEDWDFIFTTYTIAQ